MNENQKGDQFHIELSEDIADGIYSNLAVITHSPSEFVVDFISIMPNTPKARVRSRIVMAPVHAKRLMRALRDNLSKFESAHGVIDDNETPSAFPMNFGSPKGQA